MPRKKGPDSRSVRIDADLYNGIMVLSAIFGQSSPQFTSDVLRPIVEAALASHGIEFPIKKKDQQLTEVIKQVTARMKAPKG